AIDQAIEAPPALPGLSNSLNFKEFLVPTTLEVGRIIRGFERPSRLNFKKLKYRRKWPYQAQQVFAIVLLAPRKPPFPDAP
ncbi:hypothetical protein, partial [Pseudomonas sp. TR47]